MARLARGVGPDAVNDALDARQGRRGVSAHLPGSTDLPDRRGRIIVTRPRPFPRRERATPSLEDSAATTCASRSSAGRLTRAPRSTRTRSAPALGRGRPPRARSASSSSPMKARSTRSHGRAAFVASLGGRHRRPLRVFGLVAFSPRSRTLAQRLQPGRAGLDEQSFTAATTPTPQASWTHEFHRRINRAGGVPAGWWVYALLSRSLPVRYFFRAQIGGARVRTTAADPRCADRAPGTRTRRSDPSSTTSPRAANSSRDPPGDRLLESTSRQTVDQVGSHMNR